MINQYLGVSRRAIFRVVIALASLLSALLSTQTNASERVAVSSLIGDQLVVVRAAMQTGSNLDTNKRNAIKLPEQGLDGEVMLAMQSVIQQQCKACNVEFLRVKTPESIEDGEKLLPSLLAAARNNKLDRLIVLTKFRGDARVVLDDGGSAGQGKLTGLGLYSDSRPSGTQLAASEFRNGFVAPFAYFRVLAIDVQTGNVLLNKQVSMTKAYSANNSSDLDPINALVGEKKISAVIDLVEEGLVKNLNMSGLASAANK